MRLLLVCNVVLSALALKPKWSKHHAGWISWKRKTNNVSQLYILVRFMRCCWIPATIIQRYSSCFRIQLNWMPCHKRKRKCRVLLSFQITFHSSLLYTVKYGESSKYHKNLGRSSDYNNNCKNIIDIHKYDCGIMYGSPTRRVDGRRIRWTADCTVLLFAFNSGCRLESAIRWLNWSRDLIRLSRNH